MKLGGSLVLVNHFRHLAAAPLESPAFVCCALLFQGSDCWLMCIAFFGLNAFGEDSDLLFLLAFGRDEFLERCGGQ